MKPKPKTSALDKRIKPNPKYDKVSNVVNTGNNLRKELEKLEEVQQLYKFRNDEVFRRININNLVRLLIEVTKLEYQLEADQDSVQAEDSVSVVNNVHEDADLDIDNELPAPDGMDEDIESLIISQFDPSVVNTRPVLSGSRQSVTSSSLPLTQDTEASQYQRQRVTPPRPFLILDVLDDESYSREHLAYSSHYPHTRLNRAFDYETKEMLRLKNKPGSVIVLYDWDESLAPRCCTTLTQRGYENVFLLSGGLRVARASYPEGLTYSSEHEGGERLPEGEVMVLERLLEENIRAGQEGRLGSRLSTGSRNTARQLARSVSLDRGHSMDPFRTSTQLSTRRHR